MTREKQNEKLYVQEDYYYYSQTDTKLTEALKTHIIHTYTTRDIMNITSMAGEVAEYVINTY